jgi:energy-coupling factor transport system permease protein
VPAIARRLDRIRQAQQARGLVLRGGLPSRLVAVRLQMVPLVLGLIEDAGHRAQALDVRGFARPGLRTSYRTLTDPPAQRRLRAAALLLAAASVLMRLAASWPGGAAS